MAFTIPLSSVASSLAVSFTVGAPPSDTPVQVPSRPQAEIQPQPAPDSPTQPPDLPETSGPPALPDPGTVAPPVSPPPEQPAPIVDPLPPPSADAPPLTSSTDLEPVDPLSGTDGLEEAPAPQLLRPTDKRAFFSLSAGGSTGSGGYFSYYGGGAVGFSTEMMIGKYGRRHPNLGGAFVLQYRKGIVTEVSLAGRFRARKRLTKAFALYTVFDTTLGVSVPVAVGGYVYPSIPAAQLGVGWGLEAILAERLKVGVIPFAPNIVAPNFFGFPVALRWDFGVSMGIVW